jgi:hypothetical protein
VLKAVEIADDDYCAKPYFVWLGPGPFQQIAADLTDFVANHGWPPNGPEIAKSRYHNSKKRRFPSAVSDLRNLRFRRQTGSLVLDLRPAGYDRGRANIGRIEISQCRLETRRGASATASLV